MPEQMSEQDRANDGNLLRDLPPTTVEALGIIALVANIGIANET